MILIEKHRRMQMILIEKHRRMQMILIEKHRRMQTYSMHFLLEFYIQLTIYELMLIIQKEIIIYYIIHRIEFANLKTTGWIVSRRYWWWCLKTT